MSIIAFWIHACLLGCLDFRLHVVLRSLIQEFLEDGLKLALEQLVHPCHNLRLLGLLHEHLEWVLLIWCQVLLVMLTVGETLVHTTTTSELIAFDLSKLRLMLMMVIHRDLRKDLLLLSDLHLTEHLLLPLDHHLLLLDHVLLAPSLLLELGQCLVLLLSGGLLGTLGGRVCSTLIGI